MEKKKRICKYQGCVNYDPKAKYYCCNACSADAYDRDRLKKEEADMKKKFKKKEENRICKYQGCMRYNPKAKSYCSDACSASASNLKRLRKEQKEKQRRKTDVSSTKAKYEELVGRIDKIRVYHGFMKDALKFVEFYGSVTVAREQIMEVVRAITVKEPLKSPDEIKVNLYDSFAIHIGDPEYDNL